MIRADTFCAASGKIKCKLRLIYTQDDCRHSTKKKKKNEKKRKKDEDLTEHITALLGLVGKNESASSIFHMMVSEKFLWTTNFAWIRLARSIYYRASCVSLKMTARVVVSPLQPLKLS